MVSFPSLRMPLWRSLSAVARLRYLIAAIVTATAQTTSRAREGHDPKILTSRSYVCGLLMCLLMSDLLSLTKVAQRDEGEQCSSQSPGCPAPPVFVEATTKRYHEPDSRSSRLGPCEQRTLLGEHQPLTSTVATALVIQRVGFDARFERVAVGTVLDLDFSTFDQRNLPGA